MAFEDNVQGVACMGTLSESEWIRLWPKMTPIERIGTMPASLNPITSAKTVGAITDAELFREIISNLIRNNDFLRKLSRSVIKD